jgi:hypothetical protein
MRPRHVKIEVATEYGGDSRSGLYKKAAVTPGLFVKDGQMTLVDLNVYDKILDARRPAVINMPSVRKTPPHAA